MSKGGILTVVRNNIDAIQTTTHMDDSEFQVLNLKKKDFHMKLVNLYSPNDKAPKKGFAFFSTVTY